MYNLFQPSLVRFLFCFPFLLFLLHSCDFTRSGGGSWWNNAHFFPPVGGSLSSIRWEKKAYSWVEGEGKSIMKIMKRPWERFEGKGRKRVNGKGDYCCGERPWLSSLSGRKDKQVINAAGRRPNARRTFAYTLPLVSAELAENSSHSEHSPEPPFHSR